jgi:hypothetical protein
LLDTGRKREGCNMTCPICRRPVVREPMLFASEGIVHRACAVRRLGLLAAHVRKRIAWPRPVVTAFPGRGVADGLRGATAVRVETVAAERGFRKLPG